MEEKQLHQISPREKIHQAENKTRCDIRIARTCSIMRPTMADLFLRKLIVLRVKLSQLINFHRKFQLNESTEFHRN
jgi:hypothetical protein